VAANDAFGRGCPRKRGKIRTRSHPKHLRHSRDLYPGNDPQNPSIILLHVAVRLLE
jgi:hypothetical protein